MTATPGRLDLNNTFFNDAKEWVFLNPHSQYKGVKFFFPSTKEDLKNSNYELRRLPPNGDDPKHLRNSFLRFLVKVAFLNLKNDSETAYSMLIHTAGIKRDHL